MIIVAVTFNRFELNDMAAALKNIRQMLYFIGLGSESSVVLMKIKVANNVFYIFIILSQVYFIVPYVLFAVDKKILLSYVNGPLYVILCIILMILIYVDLIRNKSLIYQTFDVLDEIITKGGLNNFVMATTTKKKK